MGFTRTELRSLREWAEKDAARRAQEARDDGDERSGAYWEGVADGIKHAHTDTAPCESEPR